MEGEPSNAVLAGKIDALASVVSVNQLQNSADHKSLIEQTTRTNGRVTKLESYKNMAVGSMAVITLFILPILKDLILKWLNAK